MGKEQRKISRLYWKHMRKWNVSFLKRRERSSSDDDVTGISAWSAAMLQMR